MIFRFSARRSNMFDPSIAADTANATKNLKLISILVRFIDMPSMQTPVYVVGYESAV